jgi:superfamily II DNA or RNA helicase
VEHIVLATLISTVQSYLQTCGRGLRSAEGKAGCVIQDHGGHWHRPGMGSLNANRFWRLDFTERMVQGLAADRMREKKDAEPVRCPQCAKIMMTSLCSCGFRITRKSRPVMQVDGTLREMVGDIYKPRQTDQRSDTDKKLEQMYFRAKNSGMTFNQLEGLFLVENGYYPPRDRPYMPMNEIDFYRRVSDVDRQRLHPKEIENGQSRNDTV